MAAVSLSPRLPSFDDISDEYFIRSPFFDLKKYDLSRPDDLHLINLQYPFENNLYFFCNEQDQEKIIEELKKSKKIKNSCHFGFSTLFNYDVIAAKESEIAIICDISEVVFKYHSIIKKSILKAQTKEEFVKIVLQEIEDSKILEEFTEEYLAKISSDIKKEEVWKYFLNENTRKGSFLNDDKSFLHIKTMYQNNKIFHINLNAADKNDNFLILSKWFEMKDYYVDTIYLSNIFEWLGSDDKKIFLQNIKHLMNTTTCVIDAISEYSSSKKGLFQRLTYSSLPAFSL